MSIYSKIFRQLVNRLGYKSEKCKNMKTRFSLISDSDGVVNIWSIDYLEVGLVGMLIKFSVSRSLFEIEVFFSVLIPLIYEHLFYKYFVSRSVG